MIWLLWFLVWAITAMCSIACSRAFAWRDWRNGAYHSRTDAACEELIVAVFCMFGGLPFFLLFASCVKSHTWPTWHRPPSGRYTDLDEAIVNLEKKIQLLDDEQAQLNLRAHRGLIA